MQEIIFNTTSNLNIFEFLSYFSPELLSLCAIILNLILCLFVVQNHKYKRYSNFLTSILFCINSIILTVFIFQNEAFCIKKDLIVFNNEVIILKLFINIFAIFFTILMYKHTKKSRFNLPVVNSIFILIIMLSGLLLTSDNFTFIYILLEVIVVLIYKYSSNLRLIKNTTYSPVYIAISFCATCLFIIFYFADYFVHDILQKSIVQSCMMLALLLKIGLFPIFNYSMDKNCKKDIPHSVLLFCLLPFVGAVAFGKISALCMFNEVSQLSISTFLVLCAFMAAFTLLKTSKLTGVFINFGQVYACFYMLNALLTQDLNPEFIFIVISILFLLFSLVRFYKNSKRLTFIFSCLLIILSVSIPLFGWNMLYNIYTYDKIGFLILNAFMVSNIFIIIKTLFILEGLYCFSEK